MISYVANFSGSFLHVIQWKLVGYFAVISVELINPKCFPVDFSKFMIEAIFSSRVNEAVM